MLSWLESHTTPPITTGVLFHSLTVSQSADVSVLEGETVEITCCWDKRAERVGLKWLKNQIAIQNKTYVNQSEESSKEQKKKCAVLVITEIKRSDAGIYVCQVSVEIPVLAEFKGNGTSIAVTATENPPDSTERPQVNEEEKKIDGVDEGKRDDNSNTHIVDVAEKEKRREVIHKGKTADRAINAVADDKKERGSKLGENAQDDTNLHTAHGKSDASQLEVFTFILRSLPILVLITSFFWLYYLGMKAQKAKAASAVPEDKAASQQNIEEDQEEEKKEENVTEEAREEQKE
ncbi:uncharacterized protein LOC105925528 [Fundulus heteroclitus]|uniref:uncharacterized protein LOC105925528 n=1 Tax=Fundulus heteroclitus TaxID=8078 RepID=UPI00165A8662|nr:uncharacterized protein LOC105925528 [Fundulus heteroclitus]